MRIISSILLGLAPCCPPTAVAAGEAGQKDAIALEAGIHQSGIINPTS